MSFNSTIGNMVRVAPRRGINQRVAPEHMTPEYTPDAMDVYYDEGNIVSSKGSVKLNSTAITGSPFIYRVHGYEKVDGTQQVLVQGNGAIYRWGGGSTFTKVLDSGITDERYRFLTGLNFAFTARGHQQLAAYWDGTNYRVLGGAPKGRYPFYYQDHFFLGNIQGIGNSESFLYSSEQRDITKWNATDLWNIETNDSEGITGIAQEGRYLCVFKNSSRTLLYGTFWKQSSSSFDAQKVSTIRGLGCESHDCLVMANGALYTMEKKGIFELREGGQARNITNDIPDFWRSINWNVAGEFSGAHWPEKRWIVWAVAVGGSGTPNRLVIYDYLNDALWFRTLATQALTSVRDGTNTKIYAGNSTGTLHQLFIGEVDVDTAIPAHIVWPVFGNESLGSEKIWDEVVIRGAATGTHSNTIESNADNRQSTRLSSTYQNAENAALNDEEFRAFVTLSHIGETLRLKIKSDATAGGPWSIRQIEARGRATRN